MSTDSTSNNNLILLLGGNPYEGTFSDETRAFAASRRRLADDDTVYFVDLIWARDLFHPRLFKVDFNSASEMKEAFGSLEGCFAEIYFDYSTVKFFSVWSFSMLYKLLKPGGTIAWFGGNDFQRLDEILGYRLSRQDFYSQMEVFGFEGADDEPLRMIGDVLGFHPWSTYDYPKILRRSTLIQPLVGVDFTVSLRENIDISRTDHNRIHHDTALSIMDKMFTDNAGYYRTNRHRFLFAYEFWKEKHHSYSLKSWKDWSIRHPLPVIGDQSVRRRPPKR